MKRMFLILVLFLSTAPCFANNERAVVKVQKRKFTIKEKTNSPIELINLTKNGSNLTVNLFTNIQRNRKIRAVNFEAIFTTSAEDFVEGETYDLTVPAELAESNVSFLEFSNSIVPKISNGTNPILFSFSELDSDETAQEPVAKPLVSGSLFVKKYNPETGLLVARLNLDATEVVIKSAKNVDQVFSSGETQNFTINCKVFLN